MKYDQYIIFDTETTGLYPDTCQIIEFAAIILDGAGKKIHEIDTFVKTKSEIPPKIIELTGITRKQTDSGITEKALTDMVIKLNSTKKTLWVAHNAHFDLSFLRSTFDRVNIDFEDAFKNCDYLDTLTIYRDRAPKPHKLVNAIEHYECVGVQNSHRAIDDVLALWAVMRAMAKERNDLGIYVNMFSGYSSTPIKRVVYRRQKNGWKEVGERLPEVQE